MLKGFGGVAVLIVSDIIISTTYLGDDDYVMIQDAKSIAADALCFLCLILCSFFG